MTNSRPRRTGDGFVQGTDGHVRWGLFGAAGVVFVVADGDGGPEVLLQLRSGWSHEGGTWSCPGGALDEGEEPLDGALREAAEEIGVAPTPRLVLGHHVFAPAANWTYTTVVVQVPERFGRPLNFETEAVEWVPAAEVAQRLMHRGFASAWPHIYPIVAGAMPFPP